MVNRLTQFVTIVHIGDGSGDTLSNVISYNGIMTFRETTILLESATGFVGTIGGLMHLTRAVDRESVILHSVGTIISDLLHVVTGYVAKNSRSVRPLRLILHVRWLFRLLDNCFSYQKEYLNSGYFIVLGKKAPR